MSELTYFEYAAALSSEQYLIEVKTRNPYTGDLHRRWEIEEIAKESCLWLLVEKWRRKGSRTQSD